MRTSSAHRYRIFLLGLLMLILAFNFVDRTALGLAVQGIKFDLGLSDTQMGFIGGIGFALVYSTIGIPIARYCDRGNRVLVIVVTTVLWSAAVALCGLVASFSELLLIRVLVGIGEAGCVPSANSLIADYFSRDERPRAVSIYMQGIPLSLLLGYIAGGWLNQIYGWRVMFLAIGLPGLVLALAAWAFLKEPRADGSAARLPAAARAPLMHVLRALWMIKTFRQLLYFFSVQFIFSYGVLEWTPAYFERSFGLKSGALGSWLAIIYGLGGILGTYLVGEWATRYAPSNEARQLKGLAVMQCVCTVLNGFVYVPALTPNAYWALLWLALSTVTGMMNGPVFAVIQTLVPENMRATAVAVLYLFANLFGLGLGPWMTGALSDALRPWAGEESLRYALLIVAPLSLVGAALLWRAGRVVTSDLLTLRHDRDDMANPSLLPALE